MRARSEARFSTCWALRKRDWSQTDWARALVTRQRRILALRMQQEIRKVYCGVGAMMIAPECSPRRPAIISAVCCERRAAVEAARTDRCDARGVASIVGASRYQSRDVL